MIIFRDYYTVSNQSSMIKEIYTLNNRSLRERGMASKPKMKYQVFLCIFQKNSAMAILGLKEIRKFLRKGREKGLPCWLSQLSKTNLKQPTGQTFFQLSQRNFPISFKPKVAKAKLKKICYYEKWVGHHASFPSRRSVK